jgi:HEAT repeat protein
MAPAPIDHLVAAVAAGPPACWQALRALGELAQPDANAFLATLLAHDDHTIRQAAVTALGANRTNTEAAALVVAVLDDDDRLVRQAAGVALHRLRARPWTMPELDELLQRALEAHRVFWKSNEGEDDEDLVALCTLHDLATAKTGPTGDAAAADYIVDAGLAMLRGDDPVARIFGIRLTREMHRETEVAQAFLEVLRRDADARVVSWCIGGLGFRGLPEAIEVLAAFVTHPDPHLRYRLAGAISACAVPRLNDAARDALLCLAEDDDADVRFSALYELSSWWQHEAAHDHDPLVRQRLADGLSDADEGVRRTCAEALEHPAPSRREPTTRE